MFACVLAVLPALRLSTDARVMSVFSAGVHRSYDEYRSDPDLKKDFSLSKAANAAGMYNDIAVRGPPV